MCQARPTSDLELSLHQPERLEQLRPRRLPVRLLERWMLSHDVVGLSVQLPQGEPFRYLPGQYVDFLLDDGRRAWGTSDDAAVMAELVSVETAGRPGHVTDEGTFTFS